MSTTLRGLALSMIVFLAVAGLRAQTFELGMQLSSDAVPDLDTSEVIAGAPGTQVEFTSTKVLTSSNIADEDGPKGWSMGVKNEGVDILDVTTVGTDAEALFSLPFEVTELIDPARNNGTQGLVSAIVLSLTQNVTLPPNTTSTIAITTYQATVGDAPSQATIAYVDGLRGSGEPVDNVVTYLGQSILPTLGERTLTLSPPVEDCENGEDDDGDGDIDCADADCAGDPACQEDCENGEDDDGDGDIDCADADCADDPACQEDCRNGEDDDGDGDIDCADADCAADPTCQPETDCEDEVDNDEDGATDCDDSDCVGTEACPAPTNFNEITIDLTPGTEFGLKAFLGGSELELEAADVTPDPPQDPPTDGAQGWSIGVAHDPAELELVDATIIGTAAEVALTGGFTVTEIVDPAENGGRGGAVSAVVLNLISGATLDPTLSQDVLALTYRVPAGANGTPYEVVFEDGLVGSGEPVPLVLTVLGNTVLPTSLTNMRILGIPSVEQDTFRRGDPNDDGKVNIADPIWIINELVRGGPATTCPDAADANDDGFVDLSDATYLIEYRFLAGPVPPAPFPDCGSDPSTGDDLGCPEASTASCP